VLYVQRQQLGLLGGGGGGCCRRHHVPAGHHVTHTYGQRRVVVRQSIDEAHQIDVKVFGVVSDLESNFLSTDRRARDDNRCGGNERNKGVCKCVGRRKGSCCLGT